MIGSNAAARPLRELASFLGIYDRYTDSDGEHKLADEETLTALIVAFGVPLDDAGDADEQLKGLRHERARRIVEPALVSRPGTGVQLSICVPEGLTPEQIGVSLELEDGTTGCWKVSDLPYEGVSEPVPGFRMIGVRLPPDIGELPIGYHHLEVEAAKGSARALVISAPPHCPAPERGWGASMPLYAIRRESRDWGTGSFADLSELHSWIVSLGGNLVGTLPVLSAFVDDEGTYQGPYLPASKLAWNEAYVDIGSLPELKSDDVLASSAREWLGSRAEERTPVDHRHADIAQTLRLKRPVLELLAGSIWDSSSERRMQLDAYLSARPHLRQYAMFRSACETAGTNWQTWQGATPRELPPGAVDEDVVRYHLYVQFAADAQLARCSSSGLYLDLPVGVHPSGFDTWWEPESFVGSVSGGAPPDDFFAGGQTWGFRPLHPVGAREQGYRYVISYLRHVMSRASTLRLDHVMGLHRLWWVPDGFPADKGAYVCYQADELRALVALEAYRSGTVVAGEDLGTVPAEVRTDMLRDGMLSSFVFQFESSESNPLPEPRESVLASLGTHDLPTFRSYWNGWDIAARRRKSEINKTEEAEAESERSRWRQSVRDGLCVHKEEEDEASEVRQILRALVSYLGRSPAAITMVDLEDLMLETERQNTPGTPISEGNFSRRASFTIEQLTRDPYSLDVLHTLTGERAIPSESETAK